MPDFNGQVRGPGDREHFLERLGVFLSVAAHVGRVDATVPCGDGSQGRQFRSLSVPRRRVAERRRYAECTLTHGGVYQSLHLRELRGRGLNVVEPEYGCTNTGDADKASEIHRGLYPLEPREIAVKVGPIVRHLELLDRKPTDDARREARAQGRGRVQLARQLGCDALADLRL